MKKLFFLLTVIFLAQVLPLFAKQNRDIVFNLGTDFKKVALGTGIEVNRNSADYIAPAVSVLFDVSLHKRFSLGFRSNISADRENIKFKIFTIDVLITPRIYISTRLGHPASGFFLEGQMGESFIYINSRLKRVTNGGVCAGYRLSNSIFYLEPQFRFGYPYLFAAGITTGIKF